MKLLKPEALPGRDDSYHGYGTAVYQFREIEDPRQIYLTHSHNHSKLEQVSPKIPRY